MAESDLRKAWGRLHMVRLGLIGLAVVLALTLVLRNLPEPAAQPLEPNDSTVTTEPAAAPGGVEEKDGDDPQAVAGAQDEPQDSKLPQRDQGKTGAVEDRPEQRWNTADLLLALALAADLALIVLVSYWLIKIRYRLAAAETQPLQESRPDQLEQILVGKVHNIGKRSSQQDSLGIAPVAGGLLAVVADGMGGLSGGDQVSQLVVQTMLQQAERIPLSPSEDILNRMTYAVNEAVNRMLGPEGLYKSGSTMLAVLIQGDRFRWLSVGDSRIYLYRSGILLQLNHEHTYGQELLQQAMRGDMRFDTALADPQRHKLTSFIGMGRLKYVDGSIRSLALAPGDRLLMMSDGVFNALSEAAMVELLRAYSDVTELAQQMEAQVLAVQDPAQDNFTAVIIGL